MLNKARHVPSPLLLVLGKEVVLLRTTAHPPEAWVCRFVGDEVYGYASPPSLKLSALGRRCPKRLGEETTLFGIFHLESFLHCLFAHDRERGKEKRRLVGRSTGRCAVFSLVTGEYSTLPFFLEHWMVLPHDRCYSPWEKAEKQTASMLSWHPASLVSSVYLGGVWSR